jgi:hypothetical protein
MRNLFSVFIISYLVFLLACNGEGEKMDNHLAGNWYAKWELINPELTGIFKPEQMIMEGEVFFDADHARIRAFGFDGCAFTSDTSENVLYYKKNDTILNLFNDENDVIFSYVIKSEEQNSMELLLMDDINLTLTRK